MDHDSEQTLTIPADQASKLLAAIRAYLAGDPQNDADWDAMMDNLDTIKDGLATLLEANGLTS